MSDVTFHAAFAAPARTPVVAVLRAGLRRVRQSARNAAEAVQVYSLIEGTCLLAAMVFGSLVITAALAAFI
jgi:hypothetical protein